MSFKTIQAPYGSLKHGRAEENDGRDVKNDSDDHLLSLPLALVTIEVIQDRLGPQPLIKEHFFVSVQ